MKKQFSILLFLMMSFFLFAQEEEKNGTLCHIYSNDGEEVVMLRDNFDDVQQKYGEPLSYRMVPTKALNDAYDTFYYQYPHMELTKWKGFPSVDYIKLTDSEYYVTNEKLRIGECTISQVLEVYAELEVANYVFTKDKDDRKILVISFRTWDKFYMGENAEQLDYVTVFYGFDYETKTCVGIELSVDAD